jgi:hypothetical protein
MNSRLYWLIVVLMLGSMAMGACAAPPTPTLPAIPTPTGPGGFPTGTYKPDKKLYTDSITFTPFGTYVFVIGSPDVGSYKVSGDQIVFNAGDGICKDHPGTYQWELHGNTLTFKPVDDTCTAVTDSARQEDLEGRSWIKQP